MSTTFTAIVERNGSPRHKEAVIYLDWDERKRRAIAKAGFKILSVTRADYNLGGPVRTEIFACEKNPLYP